MGMSADLIAGISEAFDNDLADAVKTFAYEPPRTGAIDAITGVRASAGSSATGRGIAEFLSASKASNYESGQIGDIELTFIASELLSSGGSVVLPVIDSSVTLSSKTYKVIEVPVSDPTDIITTLVLRG